MHDLPDPGHPGGVQFGVTEGLGERGELGVTGGAVGDVQRECHQQRALALPQVVPGGLAGDLRIAEDPEEVGAQLERDADGGAEAPVGRDQLRRRAGERGAEVQRSFHGVGGGLEPAHPKRRLDVPAAAGLTPGVQELPAEHLGAHRRPHRSHP